LIFWQTVVIFVFSGPFRLKIRLPAYPNGVHRIESELDPEELELDTEIFYAPVAIDLSLDRRDPYLKFVFDVTTRVRFSCDRCLAPADTEFTAQGSMLYVLGNKPRGDDVDDPEIAYIPPGVVDLDISSDLRDLIILSTPEQHLCSEDCRGLCPRCGADLNLEQCSCDEPDSNL
jgi:uncharacterized protein